MTASEEVEWQQTPVHFAVGYREGARSTIWRIWTDKYSNVYIAARALGDELKISLHKETWRHEFTEQRLSRSFSFVSPGEDRAADKWKRPPEFAPGVTMAFYILVPASEVTVPRRSGNEEGVQSKKEIVWVPPAPEGSTTYFTVLFTTPRTTSDTHSGWPGRNGDTSNLALRTVQ